MQITEGGKIEGGTERRRKLAMTVRCPHEAGGQDRVRSRGPAMGGMGPDMVTGFPCGPLSSKSYLHARHPVCACSVNCLCSLFLCHWVCSVFTFVLSG